MVGHAGCTPRRQASPNRSRRLAIDVTSGGVNSIADVGAMAGPQDGMLHECLGLLCLELLSQSLLLLLLLLLYLLLLHLLVLGQLVSQ